uniref:Hydrogenase expression/formation protein HypE n=1 Tax=Candidatus Kentrum sp. TC TaxID=2126339 RepID=A0A450ZQF9_9GAMM|nr:MAG: hydrogenase expression/formation protein HypE [Candidatus Kentron sp. TC]
MAAGRGFGGKTGYAGAVKDTGKSLSIRTNRSSMGISGIFSTIFSVDANIFIPLFFEEAHVFPIAHALLPLPGLRFMRDPTRGGLATVAHEICRGTGFSARLEQSAIPVRDSVRTVCEILGYDPLYLACEGRIVIVIGPEQADEALAVCRAVEGGGETARIGTIQAMARQADARQTALQQVIVETEFGGERILEELEDDPLPRIC